MTEERPIGELIDELNWTNMPTKLKPVLHRLNEKEGSAPDLTEYYKKTEADDKFASKTSVYTKSESDATFAKSEDIPTKVSDLQNDSQFITLGDVPVTDLTNIYTKPESDGKFATKESIPTNNNQLLNGKGFITAADVNLTAYQTIAQSDAKYPLKESVPTKVSQLTNDSNFITLNQVPVVNLEPYYKKTEVDTKLSLKAEASNTYTKSEVDAKVEGVFHYRGEKADLVELQATPNPEVGDIWDVISEEKAYIWNGTTWNKTYNKTDLTNYYSKDDTYSRTEIQNIVDGTNHPSHNLTEVLIAGSNAGGNKIANLGTPTALKDATTKEYVDTKVPTKVSQLTNDSNFLTTGDLNLSEYAKKTELTTVENKIPTNNNQLLNGKGYATTQELNTGLNLKIDKTHPSNALVTADVNFIKNATPSETPNTIARRGSDGRLSVEDAVAVKNAVNLGQVKTIAKEQAEYSRDIGSVKVQPINPNEVVSLTVLLTEGKFKYNPVINVTAVTSVPHMCRLGVYTLDNKSFRIFLHRDNTTGTGVMWTALATDVDLDIPQENVRDLTIKEITHPVSECINSNKKFNVPDDDRVVCGVCNKDIV